MSFRPPAVAANRRHIARKPALGLEFAIELSFDPVLVHGEVVMPAADSGVITVDPVNSLALEEAPADLVVQVSGELLGDETGHVVVTLRVVDEDDAEVNAVATFQPPAWAVNQSHKFAEGYATDLVVPGSKKVKEILAVVSIDGGGAQGNKLKVVQLPVNSSFVRVGYTTAADFTTKTRPAVHIPEYEDGSKAIKRGRSKPGELKVTQKYLSMADGLPRYAGLNCTARAVVQKEQQVVTEHLYFGNYICEVDPKAGDGDDHAEQSASGMYEVYTCLTAL